MSWELHYTSVPRGLYPGSKGFCVVAASADLPAPLRERLEGLSGYQQVFPAHDPRAGLNPVVLAHHRLNLGGRPLSVLSRVAFAGLDYTDRSNKYAHHVVIDPSERPDGGPAWLLSRPGFLERSWSGEPRVLPPGRAIPKGDSAPAIASAWKAATGDAGWAGALAEAFLNNPNRPAYLVYEPGFDPLPLFAEALAILPGSKRWDVDFNTYFTVAPQGLTCAWRGVLAGTPAAAQALKAPGALALDLTRSLGSPGDGPLIQQARTGQRPAAASPSPSRSIRSTSAAPRADEPATGIPIDDDIPELDLAEVPPPTPSPWRGIQTTDRARTPAASRSRFHAARWAVTAALLLLLLLGAGGAYLHFSERSEFDALIGEAGKLIQEKKAEAAPPPEPEPEPEPEKPKVAKNAEPAPEPERPEPEKPEPPPAPKEPEVAVVDVPEPEVEEPKQEDPPPLPTPDFVHRPLFMALPDPPTAAGGLASAVESEPARLQGPWGKVSKITLHQLAGGPKIVGEAKPRRALKLRDPDSIGETKVWRIGPNDDDKQSATYTTFDFAEIRSEPDGLVFAWVDASASKTNFLELVEFLRDSVLELELENAPDPQFVVLRDLEPLKEPIPLPSAQGLNRYVEPLTVLWATGSRLAEARWKVEARRFRIDANDKDGKPESISGENRSKEPKTEFEIVPGAIHLEIRPTEPVAHNPKADGEAIREGDLSITLKSWDKRKKEEDEWAKIESRLESNNEGIRKFSEVKQTDEIKERIAKIKREIKADEERRKELEPNHRIYDLINHGENARLSLIIGLRLEDGRFLDLARIGDFPGESE